MTSVTSHHGEMIMWKLWKFWCWPRYVVGWVALCWCEERQRKSDEELGDALALLENNDIDSLRETWKTSSARTHNRLRQAVFAYCEGMDAENCDQRFDCIPFAEEIGVLSSEKAVALLEQALAWTQDEYTHAEIAKMCYVSVQIPLSVLRDTYLLAKDKRRPSQTGHYRDHIPKDPSDREEFLRRLASEGALVVLSSIFGGNAKVPQCYIEMCRDSYRERGKYFYEDFVAVVVRLKDWELAREALPDMLENSADCAGNLLLAMYKAGERNFAFVESAPEPVSPSETPPPVPFLVVDAQSAPNGDLLPGTELPKADPPPTT